MADHEKNSRSRIENRLTAIFAVAVVAGGIAVGIYLLRFDAGLSADPERWGQFGDYIGGVLNPFFALLGLMALLLTIVLQSRELEYTREELRNSSIALEGSRTIAEQQKDLLSTQDHKEDVYRVISSIYEEIKSKLLSPVDFHYVLNDSIGFTSNKIGNIFSNRINLSHSGSSRFLNPRLNKDEQKYWNNNKVRLSEFVVLLNELAFYLGHFDTLSGQSLLTDYYRYRLYNVVFNMHSQEYVEVELVDKFQPKIAPLFK